MDFTTSPVVERTPSQPPCKYREGRRNRFVPLTLIVIVGLTMLAWTWLGWPDPIVDFGREVYVPWQLAQGKVLYRDIAYINGPLSPYFNALMFRILGVSIHTLMIVNGVIAVAVIAMIWNLFRITGGRLSATIACLSFELLFMCTQFVGIGNYNWLTPYSHEVTHGIALGLAALVATIAFVVNPTKRNSIVVGGCIGLCLMTKPEVAAAAGIASGTGMLLAVRARSIRGRSLFGAIGSFVIAMIIPSLVATALFATRMTFADAIRAAFNGWQPLFDSRITKLHFYKFFSGLDYPRRNALLAVGQMIAYAIFLGPAWLIDRWMRSRNLRSRAIVAGGYAVLLTGVLWLCSGVIAWQDAFRGLFPSLVVTSIVIVWINRNRDVSPRAITRLMLSIFATILLMKMILAARIPHYGFALAMPAFLVVSAIGVSWLRRALTLRFATVAALCMIVFMYLRAYERFYSDRPISIAEGTADEFRPASRSALVNAIIATLDSLPPGQTLAVVPQGVMFNYLSRRENPTPYVSLFPLEVLLGGGDEQIAASYAAHPPDWVLFVQSDLTGEGYSSPEEYAPKSIAWFRANYSPVRVFDGEMRVTLLARKR